MVVFFTHQSERLLPDSTCDKSQDGLLTVLLETEKCRLSASTSSDKKEVNFCFVIFKIF